MGTTISCTVSRRRVAVAIRAVTVAFGAAVPVTILRRVAVAVLGRVAVARTRIAFAGTRRAVLATALFLAIRLLGRQLASITWSAVEIHWEWLAAAFIVVVILGIANFIVKPILRLLSLPIILITLGLFLIVVNASNAAGDFAWAADPDYKHEIVRVPQGPGCQRFAPETASSVNIMTAIRVRRPICGEFA